MNKFVCMFVFILLIIIVISLVFSTPVLNWLIPSKVPIGGEYDFLISNDNSWLYFFGIDSNEENRIYLSALFHQWGEYKIKIKENHSSEELILTGTYTRGKNKDEIIFLDTRNNLQLRILPEKKTLAIKAKEFQLEFEAKTLGCPDWWNNKRIPEEFSKDFMNFYGVDDISTFEGVIRTNKGDKNFQGFGLFEIMYHLNQLPKWSEHNWVHVKSKDEIVNILQFDNYKSAIVCSLSEGKIKNISEFTINFPMLDKEGYPEMIEIVISEGDYYLEIQSNKRLLLSNDFHPFTMNSKELVELLFEIEGGIIFSEILH